MITLSKKKTMSLLYSDIERSEVSKSLTFLILELQVLVHQVFLSFLGLLVNSRDELSLARCLSYSPTGLDHKGFTALKNLAKLKNMSMYQVNIKREQY